MSANRPSEKVARPGQSIGSGSGAFRLASFVVVRTMAPIPIGTLTKKIHSQPRPSVSAPPTSGPTATAPPIVAPQAPIAVPRSRPWNSCAISASEVANIAAPPTPCSPRARLSSVASPEIPHRKEAKVKTANPMLKIRRRPIRSANEPAVSRKAARVSE